MTIDIFSGFQNLRKPWFLAEKKKFERFLYVLARERLHELPIVTSRVNELVVGPQRLKDVLSLLYYIRIFVSYRKLDVLEDKIVFCFKNFSDV
jgi:hypothetical protein